MRIRKVLGWPGLVCLLAVSCTFQLWAAHDAKVSDPEVRFGMCDASAAVALDEATFAVISDEDDKIRIYRAEGNGNSLRTVDFSSFLLVDPRFPEADLEGAARLGTNAFWISSHGLNREGKVRLSRYRFFASRIQASTNQLDLVPYGRPYANLLRDMSSDPRMERFNLMAAARRPPKARGGLNIEGLCATPTEQLLIGFRNPVPEGKALLVPLENPHEVVAGRRAKLGDPILLDLDGLGIRDMAYADGVYFIIAGSFDGAGKSRLYRWREGSTEPERMDVQHFKKYNPEALIIYPQMGLSRIQVLSDDGNRKVGGQNCKDLKNPNDRSFRSFWIRF